MKQEMKQGVVPWFIRKSNETENRPLFHIRIHP